MNPDAGLLLTISVISHGHGVLLGKLLASLATFQPAIPFEIIVTVNVPEPLNIDVGRYNFPIKVIGNALPAGFAKNHNQAFRLSRGRYFCVLNPDVVFTEEVFDSLLRQLDELGAGIIAPRIVDSYGQLQDNFRKFPTLPQIIVRVLSGRRDLDLVPVASDGLAYPDWIAGIFLLMKADVYEKLGGFDERYFLYFEDVDLGSRCRLAGYPLVVDTRLTIIHDPQLDSHQKFSYLRMHAASALRFFVSKTSWQIRWSRLRSQLMMSGNHGTTG